MVPLAAHKRSIPPGISQTISARSNLTVRFHRTQVHSIRICKSHSHSLPDRFPPGHLNQIHENRVKAASETLPNPRSITSHAPEMVSIRKNNFMPVTCRGILTIIIFFRPRRRNPISRTVEQVGIFATRKTKGHPHWVLLRVDQPRIA